MRAPEDKCYRCGTPIVPRYGYVPSCVPCARAELENTRLRIIWSKKLSAMGAQPGKRTKRAERLRAVRQLGAVVANDNGRSFGAETKRS